MNGPRTFALITAVLVAIVFAEPALAAPTCGGKRATIVIRGDDASRTSGTRGSDVIVALGNGRNTIHGRDGNDYICGGSGNDRIFGGDGNDRLWGGSGNDLLDGEDDSDVLSGNGGDDTLLGEHGNDDLFGGLGNDLLNGGSHHDLLDGGSSDPLDPAPSGLIGDTASWNGSPNKVTADLRAGRATGWGKDTLKNIDNLSGSAHDDILVGNSEANTVLGRDGHDTLVGMGQDDGLFGGDGDDGLVGGPGNDHLDGGPQDDDDNGRVPFEFPDRRGLHGADGAWFHEAVNPITASLVTGRATGEGTDTLANIEDLAGASEQRNTLTGDAHVNELIGGSKTDVLVGNGERDELSGRGSSDGIDQLFGDNAYAALVGSPGDDRLIGGAGRTLFYPGRGKARIEGGSGALDYLSFEHLGAAVTASLQSGTYESSDASGTMTGIEQLFGTRYADTLTGDDGANRLEGWEAGDTLSGRGGSDYLDGGSVNGDGGSTRDRDPTNGGPGTDECWWGFGNADCESIHAPDP